MFTQSFLYYLEKFPSPTEYFILNEILQFENNGMDIELCVLKRQKRFIKNLPEINQLKAVIHYLPGLYFYLPIIPFLRSPISFFRIPLTNLFSFTHFLNTFRYYGISLYFAQRKLQCNHIHAHFAFISVDIARYLSSMLKVDYSCTVHAQDIYTNQLKILQHLPTLKFLVTCTDYNKNYLNELTHGAYKNKLFRVYHGIRLEKWPPIDSRSNTGGEVHLVSVARLVEKKGLIYVIKAVEALLLQGMKVHCTIIGEGPLKSTLEKYINARDLLHAIDIIPFVPQQELRAYFAQADVFVMPSVVCTNGDRDGLPNVIVEAMLSEVPVIATPVSAIPEVIKDRITGILVDERNELGIANAIKVLITDHSLRQLIIGNAKRLAEDKLDIRSSTKTLLEIFDKYCSQPFLAADTMVRDVTQSETNILS